MSLIIDWIITVVFWSFTVFAVNEVYSFFRDGAIQNIERGLSSTERFTESLVKKNTAQKSGSGLYKK